MLNLICIQRSRVTRNRLRHLAIRCGRLLRSSIFYIWFGVVFLSLGSNAAVTTFSNTAFLTINDSTNPPTLATPYPSTISVSGLGQEVVTKISVQLHNFSHTFPDDVDILLVGPEGQSAIVMSNVGGGHPGATNLNLTIEDDAAGGLPAFGPLASGTFKPTQRLPTFDFSFPSPAPASPGPPSFAGFNGSTPEGAWKLFVVDEASPDAGSVAGGWSITITTVPILISITPVDDNVVLSWTNSLAGYTLQTTPNLFPLATWTNCTPSPTIVSGYFVVTNKVDGPARFYRLFK